MCCVSDYAKWNREFAAALQLPDTEGSQTSSSAGDSAVEREDVSSSSSRECQLSAKRLHWGKLARKSACASSVSRKFPPAHQAAYSGSAQRLKQLLESGADPNATLAQAVTLLDSGELHPTGSTPLHLAVWSRDRECVKLLLSHGADCRVTNARGETALFLAAACRCVFFQPCAKEGFDLSLVSWILKADDGLMDTPTGRNMTVLQLCVFELCGRRCSVRGPPPPLHVLWPCIEDLVARGSDVGLRARWWSDRNAVELALTSPDLLACLVTKGRGMDFDRGHPHLHGRILGDIVQEQNPDADKAAVFLLAYGVTRTSLKELLWTELNVKRPRGIITDALINSFAHLPPLSELKGFRDRDPQFVAILHGLYPDSDSSDSDSSDSDSSNSDSDYGSGREVSGVRPAGHVGEKKEWYCRLRKVVPSLAHLARATVRSRLQANVRQVPTLPIAVPLKDYILFQMSESHDY
ncbi:hypothetical protein ACOMHN_047137 [Nucella lapillus]